MTPQPPKIRVTGRRGLSSGPIDYGLLIFLGFASRAFTLEWESLPHVLDNGTAG